MTYAPHELAHALKSLARELGFDDMGITSVDDPLPFVEHVTKAHEDGRFGPIDYLSRTLTARTDLRSVFPDAQTVVIVVKNYYTGDHDKTVHLAKIARYAWGKDYHQWFKKRLRKFEPLIKEASATAQFWLFNDTGPFLERAWAHKAGLGFIGKSAMFIHRGLGTWTLLGGFATSLALPPDPSYAGPDCGSCTKCLDACPTHAIIAPHTVDARRCISTWTIERPLHEDSITMAPRDTSWGFGCDICQEVCPWNKFEKITAEERFQPMPGRVFLSNETFTQDLRGSPLFRATKAGLTVNYLRTKRSLSSPHLKIISGSDGNRPGENWQKFKKSE